MFVRYQENKLIFTFFNYKNMEKKKKPELFHQKKILNYELLPVVSHGLETLTCPSMRGGKNIFVVKIPKYSKVRIEKLFVVVKFQQDY